MTNEKVALVTGASSGFGQLTATMLAQSGYRVFGTSRKEHSASSSVSMLTLDVKLNESVELCIKRLIVSVAQNPAPRLRYRVGNDALRAASFESNTTRPLISTCRA